MRQVPLLVIVTPLLCLCVGPASADPDAPGIDDAIAHSAGIPQCLQQEREQGRDVADRYDVRFVIQPGGEVPEIELLSPAGDEVAACLRAALLALRVEPFEGEPTTVERAIGGAASAPPTEGPPEPAPGPAASKSLSPNAIDEVIRGAPSVRACFSKARASGRVRKGAKVSIQFNVDPDGSARDLAVKTRAHAGTKLDKCLRQAFEQLEFPPFEGSSVRVSYPIFVR